MSSGFNTDVPHGERVFHVQTEDRGPQFLSIDTVVYRNGHILQRRSASYKEFTESPEFSSEALQQRVESQHRDVIEALRSGVFDAEIAAAEAEAIRAAGIQVQLLNPGSWLASGKVSLEVGIVRRADSQPVAGARIDALIDGALRDSPHIGTTDDEGHAKIQFDLPQLGKGDLALVIQGQSDTSKDEIRFAMRSRSKAPQPGPA
jgi:hypothetical protein